MNLTHFKLIFFNFISIIIFFANSTNAQTYSEYTRTLIPFEQGKLWGFYNNKKEIIVPPKYDAVFIQEGKFTLIKLNEKWGLINAEGKEITDIKYDFFGTSCEDRLMVILNEKWGIVDNSGKEIISIDYDAIYPSPEDVFCASYDNKWQILDKEKRVISILDFDYVIPLWVDSYLVVAQKGKYGLVNKEGKIVIPLKYDIAQLFYNGLALVGLNGKFGYINEKGQEIVPFIYEYSEDFNHGRAVVRLNHKYGLINTEGKTITPIKYDYMYWYSEGPNVFKLDNNWGFINSEGEEVLLPKYDSMKVFKDGLAGVRNNGKWGFINKEGMQVIDTKYELVDEFNNGVAWVTLDKSNNIGGCIDRNGTEYWEGGFTFSASLLLANAQSAFIQSNYLLVLRILKDFPLDDALYFEALNLMRQALAKLNSNSAQNFVTVSGNIICGCNKAISGYIVFEDLISKAIIGRCRIAQDGYYCIVLPSGRTYSYYIDAKDFYPSSRVVDFSIAKQNPNHVDNINIVSYEEMKEKQLSIRINNIFFDFNESKLKPESYPELNRLYNYLSENSDIKVEISGHTDNIGTDEYNINLSNARAKTVKEYLVEKGISSSRIVSNGYGKSNPVATNATDEGRQMNRRVEFKIIK